VIVCYTWSGCDVLWKNANWLWSECSLIDEVLGDLRPGVPGELAQPNWLQDDKPHNPYEKDKRKRFINLICKVKGYPTYDEKQDIRDDIKITIEDIKVVVKAVKGIDIQIMDE